MSQIMESMAKTVVNLNGKKKKMCAKLIAITQQVINKKQQQNMNKIRELTSIFWW